MKLSDAELESVSRQSKNGLRRKTARQLLHERRRLKEPDTPLASYDSRQKGAWKRFRVANLEQLLQFTDFTLTHVKSGRIVARLREFDQSDWQVIAEQCKSEKVRRAANYLLRRQQAAEAEEAVWREARDLSVEDVRNLFNDESQPPSRRKALKAVLVKKLERQLADQSDEILQAFERDKSFALRAQLASKLLRSRPHNTVVEPKGGDYLRPWSDDYDMPEYDLE